MSEEKKSTKPPKFYTNFIEKYPEVGKAYEAMGDAVHQEGHLTDRERALIKLAISGSNGFYSAFKAHIRKGVDAGLTREEIEQVALLMLPTKGFPAMMAAMGMIDEQFSK